jgi:hypothetical protein
MADDGNLKLFNLRDGAAARGRRFKIGMLVKFVERASKPMARTVRFVPIAASNDGGPVSAIAPEG